MYGSAVTKFPLFMRMRLVPMRSSLLDTNSISKYNELLNRQHQWSEQLQNSAITRFDIVEIDRNVKLKGKNKNKTLREIIMNIKAKTGNVSTPLIAGIDKAWKGTGYIFSFHPNKTAEAAVMIRGLYPRLAAQCEEGELNKFFTPEAIKEGNRMHYDEETGNVWSVDDEDVTSILGLDEDRVLQSKEEEENPFEKSNMNMLVRERGEEDSVSTFGGSKRALPEEVQATRKKKAKSNDSVAMETENSSTSSLSIREASRTIISTSFTPACPWQTTAKGERPRPNSNPVGAGWYERKTSLTSLGVTVGAFMWAMFKGLATARSRNKALIALYCNPLGVLSRMR